MKRGFDCDEDKDLNYWSRDQCSRDKCLQNSLEPASLQYIYVGFNS